MNRHDISDVSEIVPADREAPGDERRAERCGESAGPPAELLELAGQQPIEPLQRGGHDPQRLGVRDPETIHEPRLAASIGHAPRDVWPAAVDKHRANPDDAEQDDVL